MKYKCLFIDLDDTLWDTRSNSRESMEEVYRDYGFDRFFSSFEEYFEIFFSNNCRLWELYRNNVISKDELIVERLLFPLRPFGIDDPEFAWKLNADYLDRTTKKTRLVPYSKEVLDYLSLHYRLVIVSNGFEEVQYKKITNSGLGTYFSDIVLSDEVGYNKPHPGIFHAALERTGFPEKDTLMIGDSWGADIAGARNAGIDQAWLDNGLENAGEFSPTYHIHSLRELMDFL